MGFSGYCENSRSFVDTSAPALLLSSPTPLIQSGLVSPHNEAPDKCAAPLKKWQITNPYLDKKAWNVILHHRAAAAQLRHFTIQTPDNHPQITLQCNTHFYISIHSDNQTQALLGPKTNISRRWHQRKEKHLQLCTPDCPNCEAHWADCDPASPVPVLQGLCLILPSFCPINGHPDSG